MLPWNFLIGLSLQVFLADRRVHCNVDHHPSIVLGSIQVSGSARPPTIIPATNDIGD